MGLATHCFLIPAKKPGGRSSHHLRSFDSGESHSCLVRVSTGDIRPTDYYAPRLYRVSDYAYRMAVIAKVAHPREHVPKD